MPSRLVVHKIVIIMTIVHDLQTTIGTQETFLQDCPESLNRQLQNF